MRNKTDARLDLTEIEKKTLEKRINSYVKVIFFVIGITIGLVSFGESIGENRHTDYQFLLATSLIIFVFSIFILKIQNRYSPNLIIPPFTLGFVSGNLLGILLEKLFDSKTTTFLILVIIFLFTMYILSGIMGKLKKQIYVQT